MQKNNDLGRSMIEMLAVLAIAAIITIGGLSGFRKAMQKMKANDITETISLASTYAMTHGMTLTKDKINSMIDGELSDCIDTITAKTNGIVKIKFTQDCAEIKGLVGTSFPQCQWEKTGTGGIYNPRVQRENGRCCDDVADEDRIYDPC
ncbi:MAG: hypothetical protein IKQ99_02865 [Alphaproteobacteria bacterium]|nr:hypothetical protein [Alphaproteobacteria bacterium]